MNTSLKVAAAAALGLVLSGAVQAQSVLNEVLDAGVLKVGTTGDWNPMSLRDPATNSYKGYDIDIMNELAADLGVEVEYVPTDWKTLVNGVVAGKYQLTGSGLNLAATDESCRFLGQLYRSRTVSLYNQRQS